MQGTMTEDAIAEKLYFSDSTFTNVHQAVQHLISLA